ncbi:hypothetical protein ACFODV_15755 [Halomonas tibetensis]|uniref:Uncharacterized protein n=2 Tax=Halomonas tibetensis TaxID=2259590 RepID=A0ABV7B950_9GAMM
MMFFGTKVQIHGRHFLELAFLVNEDGVLRSSLDTCLAFGFEGAGCRENAMDLGEYLLASVAGQKMLPAQQ